MNKQEALQILRAKLEEYRTLSHAQLRAKIGEVEAVEIRGPSGVVYQIEIQCYWDDRPKRHIRVMGSVDDGGWRAYFPLGYSFIKAPDGTFVDEDPAM